MGKHDFSSFRVPSCDKCGADFVYDRRDIELSYKHGFNIVWPNIQTFICPHRCDGPNGFVVKPKIAEYLQESFLDEYAKHLEKQDDV